MASLQDHSLAHQFDYNREDRVGDQGSKILFPSAALRVLCEFLSSCALILVLKWNLHWLYSGETGLLLPESFFPCQQRFVTLSAESWCESAVWGRESLGALSEGFGLRWALLWAWGPSARALESLKWMLQRLWEGFKENSASKPQTSSSIFIRCTRAQMLSAGPWTPPLSLSLAMVGTKYRVLFMLSKYYVPGS